MRRQIHDIEITEHELNRCQQGQHQAGRGQDRRHRSENI